MGTLHNDTFPLSRRSDSLQCHFSVDMNHPANREDKSATFVWVMIYKENEEGYSLNIARIANAVQCHN